jgi:hypothetical protein
MSLARLWRDQDGWFTEGFDTRDGVARPVGVRSMTPFSYWISAMSQAR